MAQTDLEKKLLKELNETFASLEEVKSKYYDLVWYARKGAIDDEEYWKDIPKDIKKQALKKMKEVEKKFPQEIDELGSPSKRQYAHGFNCGCLAAFRFAETALDPDLYIDEETGAKNRVGGVKNAKEYFPDLDT